MKYSRRRDARHGFATFAAFALPLLMAVGCTSAESGHAPGVAGGESLTPGVTNYPLAYVKRPVPTTDIDVRDLITSITGSDLYVRTQASAGGQETNVTAAITGGKGAVRDLDVSPDGTKLVFSLRLPLDPNIPDNTDPKQPNWKIYQYDVATKVVTQLTTDDITSGHDVGPHYLPDGRIVFASTRQLATQAILLDEGRPQYQAMTDNRQSPIFLLHVMNGDGTGMHQISFNTNHDFAPSVLASGQIVFSRWEVINGADQISLYVCNPDGSGLQLLYGANSHATGANIAGTNDNVIQFLNARQRADGKLLVIDRPFVGTQLGGDALIVDATNFVEFDQSASSTPTSGAAVAQITATSLGITTDMNLPSLGGRFASVYPLYDGTNRMLVSWAPCLVVVSSTTAVCDNANTVGEGVVQAPPPYTIWVYDFGAGTLSPVLSSVPGIEIVEPVILQSRIPVPKFIPDAVYTSGAQVSWVTAEVGVLDIRSVYDVDGADTASPNITLVSNPTEVAFYQRPDRFIRIEKAVEIPSAKVRNFDTAAFGNAGMGMREILGYAPIQPDGSVQIQVPANVPFTIDVVDKNARRITPQHTSWLQLLPGETKSCNGCHSAAQGTSHGRAGLTVAVNTGAPVTGQPFPGTSSDLAAIKGETMAQTLARISCVDGSTIPCSQILSTDVTYVPLWSTGITPPAGLVDAAFAYDYSGTTGLSETPPTNANCVPWTAQCRVTIHYANAATPNLLFLQSLWNLPTRTATVDRVANSPAVCVTCHNPVNAANQPQLPSASLDLTATAVMGSIYVTSYEQLLFARDQEALTMGLPQPVMVGGAPVLLQPPMTFGSAADSTAFLQMFDGTYHDAVLDHTGFLTPAELRLISEWLDIGAQYYNDPFVAPLAN